MLLLCLSMMLSSEPDTYVVQNNYQKARATLARAIKAHGGSLAGQGLAHVSISFEGQLIQEGHYDRPGVTREYPLTGMAAWATDGSRMLLESRYQNGVEELLLLDGEKGFRGKPGDKDLKEIEPEKLHADAQDMRSLFPHALFHRASNLAESLVWLSSGDEEAISYSDDGHRYVLVFAGDTGRLRRVEHLKHHPRFGDYVETVTYDGYTTDLGMLLPTKWSMERWQGDLGLKFALTIKRFQRLTAFPSNHRVEKQETEKLVPLGHDAWIVEFPERESRALFMAFKDYVVVLEAVGDSQIGERVKAHVAATVPGKPIRYLAMSHFHPFYTWGLRPYVADGVTLITTAGNRGYLNEIAGAPYTLKPDRLQRHPREPIYEMVEGKRVFDDGTQRLEIVDIGKDSAHTDENLVFYLPRNKMIFQGDLFVVRKQGKPRPASKRAQGLYKHIQKHRMQVETIVTSILLDPFEGYPGIEVLQQQIDLAEKQKQ